MFNKTKISITKILKDFIDQTPADKISIISLIRAMNSGGFALIMVIFSLPIIIPLPPPFPSLISLPMVIFSFQMMVGYKSPWLPKKLTKITVSRKTLKMMIEKSSPYIKKAEALIKPRIMVLSSSWFEQIIGFFCFIFSMSVLLPMPLSNFLPGIGVLIASFGLLGRDGLIILLGLFIGCLGIAVTTTAVFLGVEAVYIIKNWLIHWF